MSELTDPIDRKKLWHDIAENIVHIDPWVFDDLNEIIMKQPTVDSVVHGHWIDLGEHGDSNWQCDGRGRSWYLFKCSHCGNKITDMKYLFCPNCGACMDEDTEREDDHA